jgi:hypothetical protein
VKQQHGCVIPDPELPAPIDDLRHFRADSNCSPLTRLRTFGLARPAGQAVLLLLLAYAPLPDAVTVDGAMDGIAVGIAVVVFQVDQAK